MNNIPAGVLIFFVAYVRLPRSSGVHYLATILDPASEGTTLDLVFLGATVAFDVVIRFRTH